MSLAWAHESPCVEGSALPKSVESGKLSLNKVGIGRMSAEEVIMKRKLFAVRPLRDLRRSPLLR